MIVTVPAAAAPRDYTSGATVGGPALCDLYAVKGVGGPAAWVAVSITPVGTVAPDGTGNALHCLWKWTTPEQRIAGKRREILVPPTGQQLQDEIVAESDPGWFWVGTDAELRFCGGRPGDKYEVQVTAFATRIEMSARDRRQAVDVFEPATELALTSVFFVTTESGWMQFPAPPQYHSHFEVVQGSARVVLGAGVVPLDASYGPGGRIPLSVPQIDVRTGIYRTVCAL